MPNGDPIATGQGEAERLRHLLNVGNLRYINMGRDWRLDGIELEDTVYYW